MQTRAAFASDACSTLAITTAADVSVSDGTSFKTESFFHASDAAAIRHLGETDQLIAVEGPESWGRVNDGYQIGADFHKAFALGHQYHAFLLHFDAIVTNARRAEAISFRDGSASGVSGDYPYGGTVHLIDGSDARPAGLLFEFPETPPITTIFHDWRESDIGKLPYRVEIDDGDRVFDYRYTQVDVAPATPLWFFEATGTPAIDTVQVYRLHRKLLAAHCLGDADLIANLSVPEVIVAGRGELQRQSNHSIHERFTALFERLLYREYHDLELPEMDVSGDVGWIGANVRAIGSDRVTETPFDDQWAWIMVVKKIDGVWLHAGNASNRKP